MGVSTTKSTENMIHGSAQIICHSRSIAGCILHRANFALLLLRGYQILGVKPGLGLRLVRMGGRTGGVARW